VQLPQAGIVTYVGPTFGVANRGFADGSYQNVWNFNTRSGQVTMTFDGARFQGTTFANGNSGTFNTRGPVASSNEPNRNLNLNGAFFGRGATPEYQVGGFTVNGRGYNGVGGFYGQAGR
jgi:hypothetical protein